MVSLYKYRGQIELNLTLTLKWLASLGVDRMAGQTVGRPGHRERRKSVLAIVAVLLGVCDPCLTWARELRPNELQWKQSIERPNRAWDYDGKRILGHIGHDICLWDAETGKLLQRLKGHKERIHNVQFSPDGGYALTSSWCGAGDIMYKSQDTRTILWNLATGEKQADFPDQVAGEFSPDGKRLVTFSGPKHGNSTCFNAVVWDTTQGVKLASSTLDDYSNPDNDTLHFSPDGRSFVHVVMGAFTLYNSSGGEIFNTSNGREIGRVTRNEVRFGNGHRYTSNGELAIFEPRRARLIDFKSGRTVRSIPQDLKHIWGTAWTHDGSKFAAISVSAGDQITIGDMQSGKKITGAKARRPDYAIVSPDNRRLAIESGFNNNGEEDDPEVRLYNMKTGEEIARIKLAKWGHMLGFSPDSKTLLAGGSEFAICDSENGKMIRTLRLLDNLDTHDW
jgi:WD40 repeat protein